MHYKHQVTNHNHCIIYILSVIIATILFSSCENNENISTNKNTLFFYYPWSSNLSHYFQNNIEEMKQAITESNPGNQRILIFISSTEELSYMYELKVKKGIVVNDTVRIYNKFRYTTTEGLTQILQNVKEIAPAEKYSMIIGCHGDGWIPARDFKYSFGGDKVETRTDITTLSTAIENANIKMEYILFDVCYMSTIEVIHQMRNSANHIIGTPSEMMGYGMPYAKVGKYLMGTPDYGALCSEFYKFYSTLDNGTGYGSLAVTNCNVIDSLATIMEEINRSYGEREINTDNIQTYDGYKPKLYYDLGDYVNNLCRNQELLNRFNETLKKAVPYKCHTEYVYTSGRGEIRVDRYSGISTSEPSKNKRAESIKETSWYKATHK